MAKSLLELQRMDAAQLNKMTKDVLISCIQNAQVSPDNEIKTYLSNIVTELRDLRTTLTEQLEHSKKRIGVLETTVNKQSEQLDKQSVTIQKQSEIIANQQKSLERIDQSMRETNIVVLGVPDINESLEGATNDGAKTFLEAKKMLLPSTCSTKCCPIPNSHLLLAHSKHSNSK